MSDFYKYLEDNLRGSSENIQNRLNFYIPFLKAIKQDNELEVIDIGCGRGEFIELLIMNNIKATGYDIDEQMIKGAKEKGLNVMLKDALTALKEHKNNSVDAITGFQIAEHLEFGLLENIIKESLRILKDNGILILETPNPENIYVATNGFYLDPTHIHPLPMELLVNLTAYCGFEKIKVARLNETTPKQNVKDLVLLTSPDYALIAQKKDNKKLDALFNINYGISFDDVFDKFDSCYAKFDLVDKLQSDITYLKKENEELQKILQPIKKCYYFYHWFILGAKSWILFTPNSRPRRIIREINKKTINKLESTIKSNLILKKSIKKMLSTFPALNPAVQKLRLYGKNEFIAQNQGKIIKFIDYRISDDRLLNLKLKQTDKIIQTFSSISIIGHFKGSYSLAIVNKNILKSLDDFSNLDISVSPYEEQKELKSDDPYLNKFIKTTNSDITIYHHYPLIKNTDKNSFCVALFFWEESKIPQNTIDELNANYNAIIVSSYFIKKVLIDNGCTTTIKVVNIPIIEFKTKNPTVFHKDIKLFHISSCFPRKGADILLCAFNELCKNNEFKFTLTIKTFYNPHNNIKQLLNSLVDKKYQNRVNIIFDELSQDKILKLYEEADIIVLPTRGEGLNYPAIEGAISQKPIIATGYSAHTDFLDSFANYIDFNYAKSESHVSSSYSVWANPSVKSLKEQILKISKMPKDELFQKTSVLKNSLEKMFFGKNAVNNFISSISALKSYEPLQKNYNISIVSTWGVKCGIAGYSKYLCSELSKITDIKILSWSDSLDNDYQKIDKRNWSVASFNNSDVVWFQYHIAFFDLDKSFANLIKSLNNIGKTTLITLHSTKQYLYMDDSIKKDVSDTLFLFDRVFVHSIDDLNNLKSIGIVDNVTLFPQGIVKQDISENQKEKNINKEFTIGFFGFLFPHKGVSNLLKAFIKFEKDHPLTKLVCLSSLRSDHPLSLSEYKLCKSIIDNSAIEDKIEWQTDFLDDDIVQNKLSKCDIIVLPYGITDESSSAAARSCMCCSKIVAVSPSTIFDELRDMTFQIKGFKIDNIVDLLNEAYNGFSNDQTKIVLENRQKWLNETNWQTLANRYYKIILAIRNDKNFINQTKGLL
ncbi:glycosyltransferase [Campylobacter fetus]|nr:glycosyltransferase [Campylobacter fetus]EJU9541163.1 glycosyltransferase [Campylobacter fetus]